MVSSHLMDEDILVALCGGMQSSTQALTTPETPGEVKVVT